MSSIAAFLSGSSPLVYLFIFFGKLFEVALSSLRSQLIHKGQRIPGAIVALFEYTFWLCITASAITGFADDPVKVVILVSAFSIGNIVGSILEEKMALGYCSVTGVFMNKTSALVAADLVRREGHALTLIPAEGMHGAERTAVLTTVKRKNVACIKKMFFTVDPEVVITVQSTQQVKGATIADTIK
ncbi:MAG: DUF2179 domain-containing protein [Angelakisella sp.]